MLKDASLKMIFLNTCFRIHNAAAGNGLSEVSGTAKNSLTASENFSCKIRKFYMHTSHRLRPFFIINRVERNRHSAKSSVVH